MDQDKIKAMEEEFGTNKVTVGLFIQAFTEILEAIKNIDGGGGGTPTDLTTVETLLEEIRDQTILLRIRQTQTRNATRQSRDELRTQTSILEQIELNTQKGGKK